MTLMQEIAAKIDHLEQRIAVENEQRNALINAGLRPEARKRDQHLADLRRQLRYLEAKADDIGNTSIAKTTMLYLLADYTLGAAYDYAEWHKKILREPIANKGLESVKRTLNDMVQSVFTHGSINYNEQLYKIGDLVEPYFEDFKERAEDAIVGHLRTLGNAFDRDIKLKNGKKQ